MITLLGFTLSLWQLSGALLIFFFASKIYKFFIRPLLTLQFYKNQGVLTKFHWEIIPYIKNYQNAFKKGHFYQDYIEAFKNHPEKRFMAENFGSKVSLVLMDCNAAKEFLGKPETYVRDWDGLELFHDLFVEAGGFSPKWKRSRRLVSMTFHFDSIRGRLPMIVQIAQNELNKWIKNDDLTHFELLSHASKITGNVIGQTLFGKAFNEYTIQGGNMSDAVQNIATEIYKEFFSPSPLSLLFGSKFYKTNILERHRRLNRSIAGLRSEGRAMVRSIEKSGKREKNLFWTMIDERNSGEPDALNDEEIFGDCVGLFIAGTETTSHMITIVIYFLCKYPHALEKVKAEVEKYLPDINSVTIESLNQMEYTAAFIKESLRTGGPIATFHPRVLTQDGELCGLKVKKGTMISYYHHMFYASEKYFNDPQEFQPERWMAGNQEGYRNEPYAFLPFSAGPRNCTGQHLAQIETKIVLALFIKTFDFKLATQNQTTFVQKGTYQPTEPLVLELSLKK